MKASVSDKKKILSPFLYQFEYFLSQLLLSTPFKTNILFKIKVLLKISIHERTTQNLTRSSLAIIPPKKELAAPTVDRSNRMNTI